MHFNSALADKLRGYHFGQILRGPYRLVDLRANTLYRAITISLLCWVPLFLLTTDMQRFALDLSIHVRFLLALPILILADDFVNPALRRMLDGILARGFVAPEDLPNFHAATAVTQVSRTSVIPELLIGFIIAFNALAGLYTSIQTKHSSVLLGLASGDLGLSPAYFWFSLVAIPVFQFFLLRWAWRLVVWAHVLWRISKINLRLEGAHPDKAGGLSFINHFQGHFAIILFAESSVISAHIGTLIITSSASVFDFKGLIAVFIISSVLLFLAPLLVFTPRLIRAKAKAREQYGKLAVNYTRYFREKWIERPIPSQGELLGTSDIQSLADMSNAHDVVIRMRLFVPNKLVLIPLTLAATIPMIPLMATEYPLADIFRMLAKVLL